MTPEQVKEIGDKLLRHGGNVYYVAEGVVGAEVGEEIFDELLKIGIFKCERCDQWLRDSQQDDDLEDYCFDCVEEMNAE